MSKTDEQLKVGPFERLFDLMINPARSDRGMALLLAGYAVLWTLYAVVAKSSQDIHFDMGEMVAWSRELVLGTPKHPPLGAWLVRAWFSVFPREDWAFYLFAVLYPTVALWIAWRVAGRYLSADKRLVGIALLTFVPFYNFHALKFNANTVLVPIWAATTWWFLRSLETHRAGSAIMAGIGAAAAMLGKYWSVVLIAGLGLAALTDIRRTAYFRSPAPWLTIAAGAILIAPHVAWIASYGFAPIDYALGVHAATRVAAAVHTMAFFAGILGYIAAPVVLSVAGARPSMAAISDTVWPAEPDRRTICIAFAAPILAAAIGAILIKIKVDALWMMSAMTLLPIVLLASPLVTLPRHIAIRLLALAIIYPAVMLAASPVIAVVIHLEGVPNYGAYYRLIAQAVEHAWSKRTIEPLRVIGSSPIVNGIAFYFKIQPSTLDITHPAWTPWVDEDRIRREGVAIVCPAQETDCVTAMTGYAARYSNAEIGNIDLARRYFGVLNTPVHLQILIVPPLAQ